LQKPHKCLENVMAGYVNPAANHTDTTEATMRYPMRAGRIISLFVLVWLLIGALAAWQRDYFKGGDISCATAGNIALTVIVGPLNYAGVNPKVVNCHLPQPSSMPAVGGERISGMESS
jgi:hypothetical protein